jgi:hypothetical protein
MTFHPRRRSVRVTNRSRAWLAAIFLRQYDTLLFGLWPCLWHPCQKHPSTNTADLSFGKTKSGFPRSFEPLRQPLMPFAWKTVISRSSVA